MKFTLNWLKEHLETDATLEQVTDTLTAIGLEVEEVSDPAEDLKAFTVGHVVKAEQHPNADRLTVCHVDTGSAVVQVVCGAPNARAGMKGVFAPEGTHIPGTGLDLKATKIRGVDSHGMLCSEREMMLSDEHDGIIELAEDAPIGAPFAAVAGLDDPVIEVAITPNRQDCLGVSGIARDLAAAGLGTVKTPAPAAIPGKFESAVTVSLDFPDDAANACPVFAGRLIKGVKNGPSPAWLQQRLRAVGLRPISTLVDITNYNTMDRGRPLHVYDVAKLTGNIVARLGKSGEKFLALDGNAYEVDAEMCVIADGSGVLGLGGIIGGEDTGCTEETTDVFVEAAFFDPIRTAMTGRRLGIESDARYRFERGVDPAFVVPGMELATATILELCGGEASELVIAGAPPIEERSIAFDSSRVASLAGVDVPPDACAGILTNLGFEVSAPKGAEMAVAVPSWRRDVAGPADLVEEVARIYGYDRIEAVNLPRDDAVAKPTLTALQRRAQAVRRRLAAAGLHEVVTYSFMTKETASLFGGGADALALQNPISSELDAMRPSILPNLAAAAHKNANRGFKAIALFEIGPQYADDTPAGQSLAAAGLRLGSTGRRHWQGGADPVSAYDAKADALAALAAVGAPVDKLQVTEDAPDWYHPGRSAVLRLGPKNPLARFGELHPRVLTALDLKGPAVGFEVFLENVPAPRRREIARAAFAASDLPAVDRDFAFVVSRDIRAGDLLRAVAGADKVHITDVTLFDVYAGDGLADDEKSLAISVRLAPKDKTFLDEEIEAIGRKIVAAAEKATGARLRG